MNSIEARFGRLVANVFLAIILLSVSVLMIHFIVDYGFEPILRLF